MSIDTLLRDEVRDELENLKKMELGTEAYKVTVEGVTKLVDRVIEMEKVDNERQNEWKKQAADDIFRGEQLKLERRDRRIKNGLAALGVVVPASVTVWGTLQMLDFEKEGTVTTIIGRGFINKLLPKK